SHDCDVDAPDQYQNQGCSIKDPEPKSWGKNFNDNGGGMFAMEWNKDFIKVWMFPRDRIPLDAIKGNPEPLYWGPPASIFEGDCIMDDKFFEHKIIFNVAFCGDWAGGTWGESGW